MAADERFIDSTHMRDGLVDEILAEAETITPESYYFDAAYRLAEQGHIDPRKIGEYCRDALAHHYDPKNVAAPVMTSYVTL